MNDPQRPEEAEPTLESLRAHLEWWSDVNVCGPVPAPLAAAWEAGIRARHLEVEHLRDENHRFYELNMRPPLGPVRAEVATLRAERAVLKAAWANCAARIEHSIRCQHFAVDQGVPCTCGLEELLKALP